MKKLFASKTKVATIGTPDAQIVLLKAPYLQYELLTLAQHFRQYLESILSSAKVLRMGVQKTPYQKTYELQVGVQDFTTNFIGANRQFDWVEILMVFDKSDKHLTIYDSHNAECTSELKHFSNLQTFPRSTARQIR